MWRYRYGHCVYVEPGGVDMSKSLQRFQTAAARLAKAQPTAEELALSLHTVSRTIADANDCSNVQYSAGGYMCPTCGLSWDANDDEPPECGERLLTRAELQNRLRAYRDSLP